MKYVRPHAYGLLIAALLLTSTTHGRDTFTNNNIGTTPPRQIGITLRLDF